MADYTGQVPLSGSVYYGGPSADEIGAAVSVASTAPSAADMASANEAALTFKGPDAAAIALAIEAALSYKGPTAADIAAAIAGEDTYDGPTAAEIGAASELVATYKGPTALQIATAIAAEDTYDGPLIAEYQAAFLAALVTQNLSDATIGAAVESADTFKGLTQAQQQVAVEAALTTKRLSDLEIAQAAEDDVRDADVRVFRIQNAAGAGINTDVVLSAQFPELAGLEGAILVMHDTGGGNVRYRLDGVSPVGAVGSIINAYNTEFSTLHGVDFDSVIFQFANTGGDLDVIVEVYD